jgi:ribonuclease III
MRGLDELQTDLQYQFRDSQLLLRALTHSSHAHESTASAGDNEQLEFLGDAILGFLISDFLFRAHPHLSEGQLSKLKGFFVSAANLVKFAEQLRLGEYLHLGRGEEKTGGRAKQALLVDAFEAILAAVYLDGGLDSVRKLTMRLFEPQIEDVGSPANAVSDFKTALQEAMQRRYMPRADYVVTSESGPHHQKLFAVDVIVEGRAIASGLGLTKKAAEQAAARQALEAVRQLDPAPGSVSREDC